MVNKLGFFRSVYSPRLIRIFFTSLLLLKCMAQTLSSPSSSSQNFTQTPRDKEINRNCDGPNIYCSPQDNDVWFLDTNHVLTWNSKYPSLVINNRVDFALYVSDNSREPIYKVNDLPNDAGTFSLGVDRTLFYKFDPDANRLDKTGPISKSAWFIVKPAGSTAEAPRGATFWIVDTDPPKKVKPVESSSSTSSTMSPSSSPSPTEPNLSTKDSDDLSKTPSESIPESDNSSLPLYGIILIAIACVALLLLLILFLLFWRKRRGQKSPTESMEKPFVSRGLRRNDSKRLGSTSSAGFGAVSSRLSQTTTETPFSPDLKGSFPKADAIMLSEAFRGLMRQPSWTMNPNDENNDFDEGLNHAAAESSVRLEEELALDGVGLHVIDSKKNLTIINDHVESPISDHTPPLGTSSL